MKIYLVQDFNGEHSVFFTLKRKAEKYYKKYHEEFDLSEIQTIDIPINKRGIIDAILLGAEIGGNADGVNFNC
tara:strand:- start:255 stop:473 length:219 start_codon:yes stop_codon:yes gene_type:complete